MSDRLRSIVERMNIREDDVVLEIGCGHGIAVSLICQRLVTGRVVAVDRSQKMIDAAGRRNSRFVDAGVARLICADFASVEFGAERFTKVLAARVALFQDPSARQALRRLLAPGGEIFIEYDKPGSA